jgi:hypothetical protein
MYQNKAKQSQADQGQHVWTRTRGSKLAIDSAENSPDPDSGEIDLAVGNYWISKPTVFPYLGRFIDKYEGYTNN